MAKIIAQTERLRLRLEAEGDQALWLEHMNSAEVMACLGGPSTPENIAAMFRRKADGWTRHGFSFLMLERKSDGLLIGHCGLALIEADSAPQELQGAMQIGWLLRRDCWGQGYAREAALAFLGMAFERHGAGAVYGQTSLSNAGSWRLMETLGMARRTDLDYVDPAFPARDNPTIIYRLAAADWPGVNGRALT